MMSIIRVVILIMLTQSCVSCGCSNKPTNNSSSNFPEVEVSQEKSDKEFIVQTATIAKDSLQTLKKYNLSFNDIAEEEYREIASYSFVFKGNEHDSAMSLEYNSYREPLELMTQSKRITLKNISPDYEDIQQNYFNFGFSNKLNKHLIYATYYEVDKFFLIDNTTAHIDTLIGRPYFSSDLKKIFSYYINPYAEIEINNKFITVSDIEVHIFSNNGKIEETLKKQVHFIPLEIKWKNDNTILMKTIDSFVYDSIISQGNKKISDLKNFEYKNISIVKE